MSLNRSGAEVIRSGAEEKSQCEKSWQFREWLEKHSMEELCLQELWHS